MSNPAHKEFWPKLSPFVDGELSAEERKAVEQHLAADKQSAAMVADLRAASGLVRLTYEAKADEEDFSDFSAQVLARLTPQKLPFFERMKLTVSETFTYQRPLLLTAMATAMAVLVAVPLGLQLTRGPAGYGSNEFEVQSVSVSSDAKVRPIVLETEKGDAIIWTVEEQPKDQAAPQKDEQKAQEKNEELDVDPSAEKKAGEL